MRSPLSFWLLRMLLVCLLCLVACTAPTSPSPVEIFSSTSADLPSVTPVFISQTPPNPSLTQPVETQPPVPIATDLPSPTAPQTCPPTPADQLGPFYTPGAPVRDKVGQGYVLSGVVRSAADCSPIPGAQVEFWLAGPDGNYTDAYRATEFAGSDGSYRFESHVPPPYSGRPPHIHLRISAPGFATLVTQHYPVSGVTQAVMDLVLVKS